MKKRINTSLRFAIILGFLISLTSMGFTSIPAAGQDPQPTPSGVPVVLPSGVSVLTEGATPTWYDGLIQYSTILNCIGQYPEYGAGTYVGYYADHTGGQPTPNSVYYVHVVIYGLGNSCSGMYTYIDLGLPANTSLAISATYPVFCYINGNTVVPASDCPQTLPASSYNSGMYDIPYIHSPYAFPLPQGWNLEFQVPVISSTTLTNSTLQAKVWMIDGNSSPWLTPTEGIYVFAPPSSKPGAFMRIAPTNGATNQALNTTLSWGASSGATSYSYCIDTTNDSACSTSWISTGTATSKVLSGLSANTTYYWQVRSTNSSGNTYASGSSTSYRSFTTKKTPPGAFMRTAPTNGATKQALNATISWGASSGASSYSYCIDTTNDSACSTSWTSTGTATSKVLSLSLNTTYYWQVRAINSFGTTYASGSSTSYRSFTTGNFPPGAFMRTAPTNGAINQAVNATLSWGASAGATSYSYCIDTTNDSACSTSWISTGTATSKVLSGLLHNTTYYWQVRAANSVGTTYASGSSSSYRSFKTIP